MAQTWLPYSGRSCPFKTGSRGVSLMPERLDWQPVCSLEAWCHRQWAARHPMAAEWGVIAVTGMGVRVQYPPSKILKLEGFVSRALLLVHPSSSGPVAQLHFSNRAGHWASLLPSLCPWNHGILPARPDFRRVPRTGDPWEALSTPRVPGLDHRWFSCACPSPLLPSNNKLGIFFSDCKRNTVLLLKKRKERII